MGHLLDPHGTVIGTTLVIDHEHLCWPHCRLHDPCCPEYERTGWEHNGDCPITLTITIPETPKGSHQ
jgi:hypothetical protein